MGLEPGSAFPRNATGANLTIFGRFRLAGADAGFGEDALEVPGAADIGLSGSRASSPGFEGSGPPIALS